MVIDKDLNEKDIPLYQDLNEGEKEVEKTMETDFNQDINQGIFPNFHI